jgi:RNA polymerase sigma-70 factor (ECF subfamily)
METKTPDARNENLDRFLRDPSPDNFSPLVSENLEYIRRFLYRILLNHHDADDIAQDTFIKAYASTSSFRGNSKFSTWLSRIAYNLAIDYIRRKKDTESIDSPDFSAQDSLSNTKTPSSSLSSDEKMRQVESAMAELPEKLRAAVTLVMIDDMDPSEAAKILSCPTATVYWRIHKAKKILQQKLKNIQ